MRLLDEDRDQAMSRLLLVVSPAEAAELRDGLGELLESKGNGKHVHVSSDDFRKEVTVVIHQGDPDPTLQDRVIRLIQEDC